MPQGTQVLRCLKYGLENSKEIEFYSWLKLHLFNINDGTCCSFNLFKNEERILMKNCTWISILKFHLAFIRVLNNVIADHFGTAVVLLLPFCVLRCSDGSNYIRSSMFDILKPKIRCSSSITKRRTGLSMFNVWK